MNLFSSCMLSQEWSKLCTDPVEVLWEWKIELFWSECQLWRPGCCANCWNCLWFSMSSEIHWLVIITKVCFVMLRGPDCIGLSSVICPVGKQYPGHEFVMMLALWSQVLKVQLGLTAVHWKHHTVDKYHLRDAKCYGSCVADTEIMPLLQC